MHLIHNGDTVTLHYTGTLADGATFDSSAGREPLQFTVGSGQVIEGFDKAVQGMQQGQKKTFTIPADEAYGQPRPEQIQAVPRNKFPAKPEPQVGLQLVMQSQGQQIPARIVKVDADSITLDLNHPLAGKDLTFAIEIIEITHG
ncbi:peptidylprolyl isomerase [Candidatus Woesearchaeota archaeon]|nr:peptidylprolyl isomerase [Candidatus Woesearchaeota archaeon]